MIKEDPKREGKKSPCRCPYCDTELDGSKWSIVLSVISKSAIAQYAVILLQMK